MAEEEKKNGEEVFTDNFLNTIEKELSPEQQKAIFNFSSALIEWRNKYEGKTITDEAEIELSEIYNSTVTDVMSWLIGVIYSGDFFENGGQYTDIENYIVENRERIKDLAERAPELLLNWEKTKESKDRLPDFAPVPNARTMARLLKVLYAQSNSREVKNSTLNRYEEVEITENEKTVTYSYTDKKSGEIEQYTIPRALKGSTLKFFDFAIAKMTQQNNPRIIKFNTRELVENGMYDNTDTALKAFRKFYDTIKYVELSGSFKLKNKIISDHSGFLFYDRKINYGGNIELMVNDNFNLQFLGVGLFYTLLPTKFIWKLGETAYTLFKYILFVSRQNKEKLLTDKNGKPYLIFNLSLDAIRQELSLKTPAEISSGNAVRLIKRPIENAIEEIEEKQRTSIEDENDLVKITPKGFEDNATVYEWLKGYLEIEMTGQYVAKLTELAAEAQENKRKIDAAKAKLQARAELKNQEKKE